MEQDFIKPNIGCANIIGGNLRMECMDLALEGATMALGGAIGCLGAQWHEGVPRGTWRHHANNNIVQDMSRPLERGGTMRPNVIEQYFPFVAWPL